VASALLKTQGRRRRAAPHALVEGRLLGLEASAGPSPGRACREQTHEDTHTGTRGRAQGSRRGRHPPSCPANGAATAAPASVRTRPLLSSPLPARAAHRATHASSREPSCTQGPSSCPHPPGTQASGAPCRARVKPGEGNWPCFRQQRDTHTLASHATAARTHARTHSRTHRAPKPPALHVEQW